MHALLFEHSGAGDVRLGALEAAVFDQDLLGIEMIGAVAHALFVAFDGTIAFVPSAFAADLGLGGPFAVTIKGAPGAGLESGFVAHAADAMGKSEFAQAKAELAGAGIVTFFGGLGRAVMIKLAGNETIARAAAFFDADNCAPFFLEDRHQAAAFAGCGNGEFVRGNAAPDAFGAAKLEDLVMDGNIGLGIDGDLHPIIELDEPGGVADAGAPGARGFIVTDTGTAAAFTELEDGPIAAVKGGIEGGASDEAFGPDGFIFAMESGEDGIVEESGFEAHGRGPADALAPVARVAEISPNGFEMIGDVIPVDEKRESFAFFGRIVGGGFAAIEKLAETGAGNGAAQGLPFFGFAAGDGIPAIDRLALAHKRILEGFWIAHHTKLEDGIFRHVIGRLKNCFTDALAFVDIKADAFGFNADEIIDDFFGGTFFHGHTENGVAIIAWLPADSGDGIHEFSDDRAEFIFIKHLMEAHDFGPDTFAQHFHGGGTNDDGAFVRCLQPPFESENRGIGRFPTGSRPDPSEPVRIRIGDEAALIPAVPLILWPKHFYALTAVPKCSITQIVIGAAGVAQEARNESDFQFFCLGGPINAELDIGRIGRDVKLGSSFGDRFHGS